MEYSNVCKIAEKFFPGLFALILCCPKVNYTFITMLWHSECTVDYGVR